MGGVARLEAAKPVPFNRLRQDHGRSTLELDRLLVGVVDLLRIVAAAAQAPEFLVGHVFDQLRCLRIAAEEFLADVSAALGLERLVLAIDAFVHQLHQLARLVTVDQRIPIAAPNALDDIPTRAAESRFQFLNDLAVSAHRSIQPLQIAVDNENKVVELLPRPQRERPERFRLIRLAIAQKCPYFARSFLESSPRFSRYRMKRA